MKTFYRRDLPSALSSFTSSNGKRLFKQALAQGNAEIYFNLSGNFVNQSEPAYCSLGSLVMVLNALDIDPGKRWKGVWRWYSDELLECKPPKSHILERGLSLSQLAALGRCNGLQITTKRADQVSFEEFKSDLLESVQSNSKYLISNFSRTYLGQTGVGHFSPVAAYDSIDDQVLVLDTARFKYPSYFVNIKDLYNAMLTVDDESKLSRGYLILSKGDLKPMSLIKLNHLEHWDLKSLLNVFIPQEISRIQEKEKLIALLLNNFINESQSFLNISPGVDLAGTGLNKEYINDLLKLENLILQHPLHKIIQDAVKQDSSLKSKSKLFNSKHLPLESGMFSLFATITILCMPSSMYANSPLKNWIIDLTRIPKTFGLLLDETQRLSEQIEIILNKHCTCNNKK